MLLPKKKAVEEDTSATEKIFHNKINLLSVEELATLLSVSKKTVYGWVYRKLITPVRVGPKLIKFKPDEIDRWISKSNGDSHGD